MAAHPDDDAGELVYERGVAFLDRDRVAPRTVFALLRLCAIRNTATSEDHVGRYRINGTGHKLLKGDSSDLDVIKAARRERASP